MKNVANKLLSVVIIFFVCLISCSNDDEVFVEEVKVIYSEWQDLSLTNNNALSLSAFGTLNLDDEITDKINIDEVLILVYGKGIIINGSIPPDYFIQPLPVIGSNNDYYSFRLLDVKSTPIKLITVNCTSLDGEQKLFDRFIQCRYVIIPKGIQGFNDLNLSDYQSIEDKFINNN